jgi:hypothetical protein
MDHSVLGKILATIITAAVDAGAIVADPKGVVSDATAVGDIVAGFLSIWLSHPASGKVPLMPSKGVVNG